MLARLTGQRLRTMLCIRNKSIKVKGLAILAGTLLTASVSAGPVYQPPGANLTLGDVTHGRRVLSASELQPPSCMDTWSDRSTGPGI